MKQRSKRLFRVLLSLVGLMLLLAIAFTVYLYVGGGGDADVPMWDDADLWLPEEALADEDNAFVAFMSATNHYAVLSDNRTEERMEDSGFIGGYGIAFPDTLSYAQQARNEPQAAARADAILAAHEPFFAVLAEGVRRKGYRAIPVLEVFFESSAPNPPSLKFTVYDDLLRLKAQRELERGELEAATQTVELLHAFGAKLMTHTDGGYTTLVGTILKEKAYQKMVDAVGMGLLTDEMGKRFEACLEADARTFQADYERMVRADYAFQIGCIERMTGEDLIEGWVASQIHSLYHERTFSEKCIEFLQSAICHWPGYLRFAYHPRTTRAMLADLTRRVLQGDFKDASDENIRFLTPNHIGRNLISPSSSFLMFRIIKQSRFLHTKTQLVLAAAKWKRVHGDTFPPSLEALVPDFLTVVPTDPWSHDARPLAYHPATGTVWTVGADGDFDCYDYLEANEDDKRSSDIRGRLHFNAFCLDGQPHLLPERKSASSSSKRF